MDSVARNTVLLGLGIGCTLVLSGLLPLGEHQPPDGDHTPSEGDNSDDCRATAACRDRAPFPFATPERRQLAPSEFSSPSPTSCTQLEGGKRAGKIDGTGWESVGSGKHVHPSACLPPSHPSADYGAIMAKLIRDNGSSSGLAPQGGGAPVSTMFSHIEVQPEPLGSTGMLQKKEIEPDALKAAEEDKREKEPSVTPEQGVTMVRPESRTETDLVDGNVGGRGGGSCEREGNGDGKSRIAIKEEVDVRDEDWRR